MLRDIIEKDEKKIRQQITVLNWQLEQEKLEEIYDIYQEKIQGISEVDRAEQIARNVYDEVLKCNRELADRVDTVMGILARAYEAQGFGGGLMAAKGAL